MPYIYTPAFIDGRERRRVCSPFAHIYPKNPFIHVVIPLPHKSLKPVGFARALLGSASQIQPTNPGRSPPRPPHCRKRNKKTLIQRVNSRSGSTFFIVVQTYSGFPISPSNLPISCPVIPGGTLKSITTRTANATL